MILEQGELEVNAPPVAGGMGGRLITWVLCLVFLFLAGGGSFPFQHGGGNSEIDARYAGLAQTVDFAQSVEARLLRIAVLLICCCLMLFHARAIWSGLRQSGPILALAVIPFLSLAWSTDPTQTLPASMWIAVNIAFAVFLARRFSPSEQRELTMTFGWFALLMSIVLALGFPAVGIDHREGVQAWQGISTTKNTCAIIMVYLLSPVLFLTSRGGIYRISRLLYAAGCVFVILMTQSRTGWIGIFALAASWGAWRITTPFASKDRAIVIMAISASSIIMISLIYLYLPMLLMAMDKDPTLTGRTQLWSIVITTAMKHPLLGFGYNAFWGSGQADVKGIALFLGWVPRHAHDGFLEVWLELGALGLALVLWTFGRAFRDAATCMRLQDRNSVGWYLAIVVVTITTNIDERSIMYQNSLGWVMCIMACVGLMGEARRLKTARTMKGILA